MNKLNRRDVLDGYRLSISGVARLYYMTRVRLVQGHYAGSILARDTEEVFYKSLQPPFSYYLDFQCAIRFALNILLSVI
jgi:hypothetical protein